MDTPEKLFDMLKNVIEEMVPKPDDPNSKTPCSKCVGKHACLHVHERDPEEECGAFAEKGKNTIQFKDGSSATF
jgi:hypothetical protein